jgi:hypothetical protein
VNGKRARAEAGWVEPLRPMHSGESFGRSGDLKIQGKCAKAEARGVKPFAEGAQGESFGH